MNLSNGTKNLFDLFYSKLNLYHGMMKNSRAIIAYSGGKDSTFLLNFYSYLFRIGKISEPMVFHLDHCIRENREQEIEIREFIAKNYNFPFFYKKKTFRFCPGF